jgi:hypothetical protein
VQVSDWVDIRGADVAGKGGGVFVRGTPEDDRIEVKVQKGGPLRIVRNGERAPAIAGKVARIRIFGDRGIDTIDANVPVEVPTQRAVARASGSRTLPIQVDAGPGDDRVTCRGKAQRCTVNAGAGNDTVDVRDGTRSVVDGGPGFDRVTADRSDRVRRAEAVTRA